MSVSEPSGRVWLISQRRFRRPRTPGRRRLRSGSPVFDVLSGLDLGNSLTGVVFGIAAAVLFLAMLELLPFVIVAVEFAVLVAAGGVQALLGRRIVVAESDGDAWTWTVTGRPAAVRLAGRVARAVRDGSPFPPDGRFEHTAAS